LQVGRSLGSWPAGTAPAFTPFALRERLGGRVRAVRVIGRRVGLPVASQRIGGLGEPNHHPVLPGQLGHGSMRVWARGPRQPGDGRPAHRSGMYDVDVLQVVAKLGAANLSTPTVFPHAGFREGPVSRMDRPVMVVAGPQPPTVLEGRDAAGHAVRRRGGPEVDGTWSATFAIDPACGSPDEHRVGPCRAAAAGQVRSCAGCHWGCIPVVGSSKT